ncbi:MAG TPA: phenylalanine--tRNA ligase beta subunit-related protein, partial [Candidatus Nitrosocosmicus sp.]|nr:phenylalanine--tRNA ligase beta subunit-related protein [Candidatus Nitrosocosmicus sp.]
MGKFIVEDSFWELFPDAGIGVIVAEGIDNTGTSPDFEAMLKQASGKVLAALEGAELAKHPVIAVWREAYKKFKSPRENRSSIEALIRRIYNGKQVGNINPLVDIYNYVSLKHMLPCGGEDLDVVRGAIRLTRAKGDEPFVPLGSTENEPPAEGEVIYRDDEGAMCRCWNWREADRTKLTEGTRNAFLCIESVDSGRRGVFE